MSSKCSLQILMATYNGRKFISEQIESIRNQSITNWELLISDDCSTDGTLNILREYELIDPRIRVISSNKRFGSARDNFLFLLTKATADYVMFSDQDDVWDEDKIEITLAKAKELESDYSEKVPIFVFTDSRIVDEELNIICESGVRYGRLDTTRILPKHLAVQNLAGGCTSLINKSLLDFFCAAEKPEGMVMHDWWLIQIASVFGKVGFVERPTMCYRQHYNNSVGAGKKKMIHLPAAHSPSTIPGELTNAEAFYQAFRNHMDEDSKRVFRELALIGTDKGKGLLHLIRSGAWMGGTMNKLYQIRYSLSQKWL